MKDASGRKISGIAKRDLNRLRRWQFKIRGRLLSPIIFRLNEIGEKLRVSKSVVDRSIYNYRLALRRGVVRGRPLELVVASILYVAIRQFEISLSLKEVAKAADADVKESAKPEEEVDEAEEKTPADEATPADADSQASSDDTEEEEKAEGAQA